MPKRKTAKDKVDDAAKRKQEMITQEIVDEATIHHHSELLTKINELKHERGELVRFVDKVNQTNEELGKKIESIKESSSVQNVPGGANHHEMVEECRQAVEIEHKRLENINNRIGGLVARLDSLTEILKTLKTKIVSNTKRMSPMKDLKRKNQVLAETENLKQEAASTKDEMDDLTNRIDQLNEMAVFQKTAIANAEQEVENSINRKKRNEKRAFMQKIAKDNGERIQSLENEVAHNIQTIGSLETRIKAIDNELESVEAKLKGINIEAVGERLETAKQTKEPSLTF